MDEINQAIIALDTIINVPLSMGLAGLSIAAATFAFVANSIIRNDADEALDELLETLKISKDIDNVKYRELRFEKHLDVISSKDKRDSKSNSMIKYFVNSFYFFILSIVTNTLGDSIIGKDEIINTIQAILFDVSINSIIIAIGLILLCLGAKEMTELVSKPRERTHLVGEIITLLQESGKLNANYSKIYDSMKKQTIE